ncbi:MAG: hypothetical protein ACKVOE_06495 [Rickettsiales bacterium]
MERPTRTPMQLSDPAAWERLSARTLALFNDNKAAMERWKELCTNPDDRHTGAATMRGGDMYFDRIPTTLVTLITFGDGEMSDEHTVERTTMLRERVAGILPQFAFMKRELAQTEGLTHADREVAKRTLKRMEISFQAIEALCARELAVHEGALPLMREETKPHSKKLSVATRDVGSAAIS